MNDFKRLNELTKEQKEKMEATDIYAEAEVIESEVVDENNET